MKYSFTNEGSQVILKAITDMKLNGRAISKGEPICSFNNVFVDMRYQTVSKDGRTRENLFSSLGSYPTEINILGIANQDSLLKLIFKTKNDIIYIENNSTKVTTENLVAVLPIETGTEILNLFAFDMDKNKVEVNVSGNVLTFQENGTYSVFYEYKKEAIAALEVVNTPTILMEMIVKTKGNIDGETGYLTTVIPSVTMNTEPLIHLSVEDPFSIPLRFKVIESKTDPINCYFSK